MLNDRSKLQSRERSNVSVSNAARRLVPAGSVALDLAAAAMAIPASTMFGTNRTSPPTSGASRARSPPVTNTCGWRSSSLRIASHDSRGPHRPLPRTVRSGSPLRCSCRSTGGGSSPTATRPAATGPPSRTAPWLACESPPGSRRPSNAPSHRPRSTVSAVPAQTMIAARSGSRIELAATAAASRSTPTRSG